MTNPTGSIQDNIDIDMMTVAVAVAGQVLSFQSSLSCTSLSKMIQVIKDLFNKRVLRIY